MAKQYWVGEFFVDLSRNQISQHSQPQTLPPKALLVLTHLAENHGKVVSHDELLDKVWPNTVVTPNTLQRSIAQLRKALGENSKAQSIIKTHSKQGYSLECEVVWSEDGQAPVLPNIEQDAKDQSGSELEEPLESSPEGELNASDEANNSHDPIKPHAEKSSKKYTGLALAITAMVVVMLVIFLPKLQPSAPQLQFSDLRYVTATDNKEYGGTYSSDGKYILFHRYYNELCINDLWAKNTETLEEIQLTQEEGTYEDHNLSPDGKNLLFIKKEDCTKPVDQLTCYKLMNLNFTEALKEPQKAEELIHCQNSAIRKPVWLDGEHVAMMQNDDQGWRIVRYSLKNNSSSNFYQIESGNVINFTYSVEREKYVVASIKDDGLQYIETLSSEGELLTSHPIRFPEGVSRHIRVDPEFVPNSSAFLFAAYGQLYNLSEQGEVSEVLLPIDGGVGAPDFHPDGGRLLLIKGHFDSDVAAINFSPEALSQVPQASAVDYPKIDKADFTVLERSIETELHAKFQPKGSAIAISSERTSIDQVWLIEESGLKVVSKLPKGAYIKNLQWSSEGDSLLVLSRRDLHQVNLNTDAKSFNFPYPVNQLFHWDSNKNQVTANIQVNGSAKFVKIDLNSLEYEVINSKKIKWAALSQNGTLVFMDHMDRFWKKGAVEDELLEILSEQGSSKRFVFSNEVLYGLNSSNQLWSYDIQSGDLNILADIQKDINFVTDVRKNELLVNFVVAAKKEVIEFSVSY